MSRVVIRGGVVADQRGERRADVAVDGGRIVEVSEGIDPVGGAEELDASGCLVTPGLVDLHTHLREPGMEDAETVETGARAAALGGFTAVVAMPNTEPPIDDAAVAGHVLALGRDAAVDVHVAGSITVGRSGTALAPMGDLHETGVRIFTDDGDCVADARLMRRALEYARALPGAVLAQHAEDPDLAAGGHMHEGAWSSRLGVAGRPAEAETVVAARDIELCRLTGGRLHLLHVSSARTVELVREAKAVGLAVTAEVTPHHLVLTDDACAGYDPRFKVNPPLRTVRDRDVLRSGLAEGTIDAVATDHAPHPPETKDRPFSEAPPGMLGLETALAVVLTELVETGVVDRLTALAGMSWRPAAIAGLEEHGRPVEPGEPANLCVIDPELVWEVDPLSLASRSRNTPWIARKLKGRVRHTVVGGSVVVSDGEAQR